MLILDFMFHRDTVIDKLKSSQVENLNNYSYKTSHSHASGSGAPIDVDAIYYVCSFFLTHRRTHA